METKKPFFARLLESEKNHTVKTGVEAGFPYVTHKYPSDDDEGGPTS